MDATTRRISDGWERVRPDLPTRSVAVLSLIKRAGRQLHAQRASLLKGMGTDQSTLELLAELRRHPGPEPLSPGQLARLCAVTPGAISQRLRRAQEAGWVVRSSAPDGRTGRVALTPEGIETADAWATTVLQHDDDLTRYLTDEELALLETLLERLVHHLDDEKAETEDP